MSIKVDVIIEHLTKIGLSTNIDGLCNTNYKDNCFFTCLF